MLLISALSSKRLLRYALRTYTHTHTQTNRLLYASWLRPHLGIITVYILVHITANPMHSFTRQVEVYSPILYTHKTRSKDRSERSTATLQLSCMTNDAELNVYTCQQLTAADTHIHLGNLFIKKYQEYLFPHTITDLQ